MIKVIVERARPEPEAVPALTAALQTALPGKVTGVGLGSDPLRIAVFMVDGATAAEQDTARTVVLAHDMTARTAAQAEAVAIGTDGADVIARYLASPIAAKTPAQIYTLLQNEINAWASLADAKADLANWLPLMAAICQHYIRRMSAGN